ncbi:G-protein coupled receptor GRL101-like [Mercenaria mercenaria]|uniref:G-protein coupled receptor GRL101-like n=1 Tax=Mercenaria mercenaria TaxID=6596 RepID=UPI00234F2550|nr:G-protein coupled receptor GRL101-like [Mercenaria mercenaria]
MMWLTAGKLEIENTWQTVTCDRKKELMLHICEQRKDGSQEKRKVHLADCFESSASHYKGNVSITRYGHTCQRWDSQLPNEHNFTDHADFPDETLTDASNHCRSPDNDHTPWCFVMDSMIVWDYCEVKLCTSDEDIQPPKDPVTLFRCKSGEWMSHTVECNGIAECLDKSDEANCTTGDTTCKDDEFTCTDGRCIHVFQICDFNADCNDASDEFCVFPACDYETEYRCDSGQCISNEDRCDSIKQCTDGSDENFCEKCNTDRAFQCDDKTCISKRLKCDLHTDCLDGADEDSAMCTHIYTTCDDVWQDGLTEDGIYPIGDAGYRARCSLNRTSGFLSMEFLNNDWRRLGERNFHIDIPDRSVLDGPNAHGYLCTQQYDNVPHRDVQRTMMIENSTLEAISHIYELNFGRRTYRPLYYNFTVILRSMTLRLHDGFENRIKIHNLKCKKGLGLWDTTSFCEKGQKSSKQYRWCEYGIDELFYIGDSCDQMNGCGLNRWNENIYCSVGKSTESTKECLYDLDENGITTGCRSLNHLQNCENVSCPAQHFKCPESYCVPLMYVCNGRIDCPGGQDETYCECKSTDRKNVFIIVPSSDFIPFDRANILFETATRLGGTLFSKNSKIRVLKMSISPDPDESPYRFDSSDIESNSEHPNYIFERYVLNETDNPFPGTFQDETSVILWLSDTLDATESENYIFKILESSKRSGPLFKYRVVIAPFAQKAVSVRNQAAVTELLIRDYNVLGTLAGAKLFPDICTGLPVQCANRYRCSLSMVCIPHEQVCDGRPHCPYGDDEELCNFTCPDQCLCNPYIVSCTNVHVSGGAIEIPVTTRVLDASNTTLLGVDILTKPGRYRFPLLVMLNLSRCGIMNLTKSSFEHFLNLLKLDISFNRFTKLPRDVFVNLQLLQELHLSGNKELTVIEPGAFNGLNIKSLSIKYADLEMLYAGTFAGLALNVLDLSSNNIKRVEDLAFSSLTSQEINIKDNPLTDFSKRMFDGVTGVESLYTPAYKYCCVRPVYLNEEKCLPYKDEFSSCNLLMRNTTLQVMMWTISSMALIGNLLSIAYRLVYDKKRLKIGYGIFVTNLAISDLLMGMYMLIIVVADKVFMDRYIDVDEYWRNSAWCKFAGVISTLSSEASVLFVCLITIDRVLVIKFPFGEYRLTTFYTVVAVLIVWALSFLITLLPVLSVNFFQNKVYSDSGVCLALPLTRDGRPGWLCAISVFVGFNLITFILIAVGQILIYTQGRKHPLKKKIGNVSRSNDLEIARNLLLLVTTDFLCWVPVGLIDVLT